MDKLEYYLGRVCRSIGGPKPLRQHVRQELREHLLDAAAQHQAAGMSPEAALDRALMDFGGPEEVRSALEETHGHRLLPVLIDKAMQWKEQTMRAKWLWTTWAHLALAGAIALEVMGIVFAVMYLTPKFQRLMRDGWIDPAILDKDGGAWMVSFLDGLSRIVSDYTVGLIFAAAVVSGLFEWRVRGDNKSFIRLSAWGTLAMGLMVVVLLTAFSLIVPFMVTMPAISVARPFAVQQIARLNTSMDALEKALAKKDWKMIQEQASQASQIVDNLAASGPVVGSLTPRHERPRRDELLACVKSAAELLSEARRAAGVKDAERVEAALRKFHEEFEPVEREAAKPERQE